MLQDEWDAHMKARHGGKGERNLGPLALSDGTFAAIMGLGSPE